MNRLGTLHLHADLDLLLTVVERLSAEHRELDDLATGLHQRVARLHETWDGAAATAHVAAQAEWNRGFTEMRAALGDMRSVAETARRNYAEAAETNAAMWGQLG